MNGDKVAMFIDLAGQSRAKQMIDGSEEQRRLGAQLLLSEVLEYVVHGLGVQPVVNGVAITEPNRLEYRVVAKPDREEVVDGLSDVAYTMFWNALTFGVPLEKAFDAVCENNLTKFVALDGNDWVVGYLPHGEWHCGMGIVWPDEVSTVAVVKVNGSFWAVGKDRHGKVRKPSSYQPVDLSEIVRGAEARQ